MNSLSLNVVAIDDVIRCRGWSARAVARMQKEGLLELIWIEGTAYIAEQHLLSIEARAVKMPTLITCECEGPCKCNTF